MPFTLSQSIKTYVAPWVEDFGISRLVLTRPTLKELQRRRAALPTGVFATPKPLKSRRRAIRGERYYRNYSLINARWPADHLHSSRAPLLEFVLSGSVAMPFGDYLLHCKPGHIILSPPGVPYSDGTHLLVNNKQSCDLFKMRPYSNGLQCWMSHTSEGQHWTHRETGESCRISNHQTVLYLEGLCEELQNPRSRSEHVARGLLLALVNVVLREIDDAPDLLPAVPEEKILQQTLAKDPHPMAIAEDYINTHLGDHLTIEKVARHVYMSERSFTEHFRKQTGQSFVEYLTVRRLKKATQLLASSDWPIEQVAAFVGLKSGRLRALFHEKFKKSPSDYREAALAKARKK